MERAANSVTDKPREAPKVSNALSLRARGIGSALACSADRPMLRRKKDTRREKDIVKDSTRRGDGRLVRLNRGGKKKTNGPAYSSSTQGILMG